MPPRRDKQLALPIKTWGGKRKNAGRKPNGEKAMMPRTRRPRIRSGKPVHVTVRLHRGLPSLRVRRTTKVILETFAKGKERFGFRLVYFSIQGNHIHFIVECRGKESLSRGMKGLQVRLARALNKHWRRSGSVFSDRYHARILSTPTQLRNTLVYVLHNAKKHLRRALAKGFDEFSAARMFAGWIEKVGAAGELMRNAVVEAKTWLLTVGWLRGGGRISIWDRPASAPP